MTDSARTQETPELDYRYFLNRELSWLSFNERVLEEAVDPNNPLLEKLKFIAITGSNLDEFFMIRVAGLMHQRAGGIDRRDNANMTPAEQLTAISRKCKQHVARQYRYLHDVLAGLYEEGLRLYTPEELTPDQAYWLNEYFDRTIYPVVTPLAVDASHPFPFLMSRSLNLAVMLHPNGSPADARTAILPVPSVLPRLIEIPGEYQTASGREFVWLEDVLRKRADAFFQGHTIIDARVFRITRDADLDIDEEGAEDLLDEVEKS